MRLTKKIRNKNLKLKKSKGCNFNFVLYQTGLKHSLINKNEPNPLTAERVSEYKFREEISKLKEKSKPDLGDILTIETEFGGIVRYAGIISSLPNEPLEIWNEQFEGYVISPINEIKEIYCKINESVKLKYYASPLSTSS